MVVKRLKWALLFFGFFLIFFTNCEISLLSKQDPQNGPEPYEDPEPGGGEDPEDTTEKSYTISYTNMAGATNNSANPGTYTNKSPKIKLEPPVMAAVYFVCWRINSSAGAPVSSIPAGSSGNRTFYAQWTTKEEYNIIAEANRVRTAPKDYANMLLAELKTITNPADQSAYEAAITTLNEAAPRSPLNFERGLYFAASAHAEDLKATGTMGHDSSDKTTFYDRVRRYGTFPSASTSAGENAAGGTYSDTGAKMVKQWVLSPAHLNNILHPSYTQTGASLLSGHPLSNWVSVQVFAWNFTSNPY